MSKDIIAKDRIIGATPSLVIGGSALYGLRKWHKGLKEIKVEVVGSPHQSGIHKVYPRGISDKLHEWARKKRGWLKPILNRIGNLSPKTLMALGILGTGYSAIRGVQASYGSRMMSDRFKKSKEYRKIAAYIDKEIMRK